MIKKDDDIATYTEIKIGNQEYLISISKNGSMLSNGDVIDAGCIVTVDLKGNEEPLCTFTVTTKTTGESIIENLMNLKQ